MKVSATELRRAVDLLLEHIEESGSPVVEIDEDFYWDVPADRRYAPYQKPVELTMGQLSDDWSEIQKIVDGSRQPVGYALVWLSSILRRVGEKAIG